MTEVESPRAHPAPRRTIAKPIPRDRIRGLDGLRAVAVSAVVLYHLGITVIPGGFLGVDIFFVISGFLITTLLVEEMSAQGRIRLGTFYLRRARRLLPALLIVLVAVLILAATIAGDVASQVKRDIPAALVYVSNWWAIGQDQSYFELIGRGNMLAHLWSLAVEEQFYLVWPAILVICCWAAVRFGISRQHAIGIVAATGAVASTAWMVYLSLTRGFPLDADPTRAYFGTDTHAMSVLVGAALATVWNPRAFRTRVMPLATVILVLAGVVGLALTGALLTQVSEYSPWLYRGGFLMAALVFAFTVAASTHPASPVGAILDVAPIRWVGERSYGIYLWHWPIFLVTRPGIDNPWTGPWVDITRIALVLLVAEASYRWIEVPIRRGAIGRHWTRLRADIGRLGLAHALAPRSLRAVCAMAGVAVVAGGLVASLTITPRAIDAGTQAGVESVREIIDDIPAVAPSARASGAIPHPSPSQTTSITASPAAVGASVAPITTTPRPSTPAFTGDLAAGVSPKDRPLAADSTLSTADISWFGDSVTLWSAQVLRQLLPGLMLDAGINRSPGFIEDRVLAAKLRGTLRAGVVMHLGDVGPVSPDRLNSTLTALSDRERIVLVNSTARFAWVPSSNVTLRDVALEHPNVVVADWYSYSRGHTDWFSDGLHLTTKGKPIFAAFVRQAMLGV